jgi:hypothetical protein
LAADKRFFRTAGAKRRDYRRFDSAIYKGEACENESAGVLIREDEKEVTIALDRCLDTEDVRLVLCVPKARRR